MAETVWPVLNLEALSATEQRAIRVVCELVVDVVSEPSPTERSKIKRPAELRVVNELIQRELRNEVSSHPWEFLMQMGMSIEEVEQAFLDQYEYRIV